MTGGEARGSVIARLFKKIIEIDRKSIIFFGDCNIYNCSIYNNIYIIVIYIIFSTGFKLSCLLCSHQFQA